MHTLIDPLNRIDPVGISSKMVVITNCLRCALFAVKTYDYRQDFHFHHKTKHKAVGKTLEQRFLREFKATRAKTMVLRRQKAI